MQKNKNYFQYHGHMPFKFGEGRISGYIYKNYAIHLPLVDMLFGKFKLPEQEWPTRYGVFGKSLPDGILRQHLYPLLRPEPKNVKK